MLFKRTWETHCKPNKEPLETFVRIPRFKCIFLLCINLPLHTHFGCMLPDHHFLCRIYISKCVHWPFLSRLNTPYFSHAICNSLDGGVVEIFIVNKGVKYMKSMSWYLYWFYLVINIIAFQVTTFTLDKKLINSLT